MIRPRYIVLGVIVALGIAILIGVSRLTTTNIRSLAQLSDAGVKVDLSLEQTGTACVLAARYTPLRDHFHVYSKDLPPDGVNGLGRPTRLEVSSGLVATGELSADAATIDLQTEGLDEILPVYPDGAVTLRLPIRNIGNGTSSVKVGYMACSLTTCLNPTTKIVNFSLDNQLCN